MRFLPLLALAVAIATSAFTKAKQLDAEKVWFKLDLATGQPVNASSGGLQSDTDPFTCSSSGEPCSISLSVNSQVVDNHNGTYGIATGVDPSSDYIDRDYQPMQ